MPGGGNRNLAVAALLGAVAFGVYHAAPVTQMYDSFYLSAVSHSLWNEGDLTVPLDLYSPGSYQLYGSGGKLYHSYPNAPAVLNLPVLAVYQLLGVSIYDDGGQFLAANEVRVLRTSAALATALTVVFSFVLARLFLGVWWSLSLSVAFAFGTQLFSTASRPFWSHAWGVALLTLALYLALRRRPGRRGWEAAGAGTALAWATFCRPPFALSALAVTLFYLQRGRWRELPWLALAGGGWLGLFVLYSVRTFGTPVPRYFLGSHTEEHAGGALVTTEALWGTLASPGRGLFVFVPLFALILLTALQRWARLESRLLAGLAVGVVVLHWLVVSSVRIWWGGGSFGPRVFTDVVPWFLLLAVLAVRAETRERPVGGARLALWSAAAALSIFINARGALSPETFRWGELVWARDDLREAVFRQERLWNWRYPQFLAGLVPVPPPDRFVSWICSGRERLLPPRCRHRLTIRLRGAAAAGYALRLSTDATREGRLDENGDGRELFPRPRAPSGTVTALWDCGTVITVPYACSPRPPEPADKAARAPPALGDEP